MGDEYPAWVETLDAYETRLEASRAAITSGDLAHPPPFQPTADLGPIPAGLVDRAAALLGRSRDLEALITKARSAIEAKLAQPSSAAAAAPRRASRLDISV